MDRERVCCFTGHRVISKADLQQLERRLDEIIAELIGQGIVFFGSGMARGFDTLAAQAVLKARRENAAIKLIAVLPCNDQDSRWSEKDKQTYGELLDAADKIVYVSNKPYFDGCMAARNLHLAENSSVCVAYMTHGRSGTAQTVRLARERSLSIINLAEK